MTKGEISKFFVKYLPIMKTGRKKRVPMWRIVKAILYKLKTGTQWSHLPMRELFGSITYSWQSVFYHFNKWSQCGIWDKCYDELIKENRRKLDLSVVNLDGSHTPAKRGREQVGYQGRKKSKTTNMLILTDRQGVPIGYTPPISGQHHDAFDLVNFCNKIFDKMEQNKLRCSGLFLNADAGFDVQKFRELCDEREISHNIDINKRNKKQEDQTEGYLFDNELYKKRFSVEQLNAWVDGFKTLRIRYETKACNWMALHCLAFSIIFLRKFNSINI